MDWFERLKPHIGHELVCVSYGEMDDICIECETCNEVLISAEAEESEE